MEKLLTKEEAIKAYKLDRRRKWIVFGGNLVYNINVTLSCSGCDGGGCFECGYQGKRINGFPIPAMINGDLIKVSGEDFS